MKDIFLFELKYRFTRPATYLYFLIFFLLPLMAIMTESVSIGATSEKVFKNAPVVISTYMAIMSIFGILVASAIMGVPVYRDIEYKTNTYFFSLPISEKSYLLGRFFGSFLTLAFVFLSVGLAVMLGSVLAPIFGLVPAERFGEFNFMHYFVPYCTLVLPNLFLSGTIFFSLVALTRNVFSAYVGNVVLLMVYILSGQLMNNLDNRELASLLDAFGLGVFTNETRYWTVPEQNSLTLGLTGMFLYNRIIWVGFSLLLLGFTLWKFDFQKFLAGKMQKAKKESGKEMPNIPLNVLPKVSPSFSFAKDIRSMFSFATLEFRQAIGNVYFLAMTVAAVIFLAFGCWQGDEIYGTKSLPTTAIMIDAKNGEFSLLVFIILIFYTGEMVFRERVLHFSNITDSFPVPNWLLYFSKFIGLTYICLFLMSLIMLVGMTVQTLKGYFNYEIDVYLIDVFIFTFPNYLALAMLSFFIQVLVNNKFVGYFAVGAFWIFQTGLAIAEYSFNLYRYANTPNYLYSDMNRFGHFWQPLMSYNAYWLAVGAVLLVLGNLLWVRGINPSWRERWALFLQRFAPKQRLTLLFWVGLSVLLGSWNYYNTAVLNKYRNAEESRILQADYEKKYKKYDFVEQPKALSLKLHADLFPADRSAKLKAIFKIYNPHDKNLDSLYINVIEGIKLQNFTINGKPCKLSFEDKDQGFYIYQLPQTLKPQDTVEMLMEIEAPSEGFTNSGYNRQLVENGTFFDTQVLPSFGYNGGRELSSEKDRKKYNLPEKKYRLPETLDKRYENISAIGGTMADYISFEAIISTEPDQVAITPGYLKQEWTENGRRYFHYDMENAKDFLFYGILSARYEIIKDKWVGKNGQEVNIEIYHHPAHTRNTDKMIKGIKASLDYFTENFAPYQHRQMRIMEFPRYATFAQSFANTVPYAESFGWVGDFSDPNAYDYVFFVTSHEVAHQWWGHQVLPRGTRGGSFVIETMAEYSALMVAKKEYGADKMQKFLKYELDRYLRGRASEAKQEPPLLYEDQQSYLYYRKGSMVMYALADYLGEDVLNAQLKKYVDTTAYRTRPYTTSLELYDYIKAATPDSLKATVADMFEKVTLLENRAWEATYEKIGEEYEVTLKVSTKKFYADEKGNETEQPDMRELIDIGVTVETKTETGMKYQKPLYLQKHWLKAGEHTLKIRVKEKPEKAGIDPYNKLIDRNANDNTVVVKEK